MGRNTLSGKTLMAFLTQDVSGNGSRLALTGARGMIRSIQDPLQSGSSLLNIHIIIPRSARQGENRKVSQAVFEKVVAFSLVIEYKGAKF